MLVYKAVLSTVPPQHYMVLLASTQHYFALANPSSLHRGTNKDTVLWGIQCHRVSNSIQIAISDLWLLSVGYIMFLASFVKMEKM